MRVIATTSQSKSAIAPEFKEFLQESGFDFVPRRRKGLKALADEYNAQGVVVWQAEGPVLYIDDAKFFFHPSMAKNRIALFRKSGFIDPLARACSMRENSSFLDCTLGLGADAVVASYFSPVGRIVGLESSAPAAYVVKWGMKLYKSRMPWLDNAIKKIEVINCDHHSYLQQMQDDSFDIVYFDPMFRRPLLKSQAIAPLRLLANREPLEKKTIIEACRVARQRVVLKELVSSQEFKRLGFEKLVGNPHNKIAFGIIETR